jgi:hypothetical protein
MKCAQETNLKQKRTPPNQVFILGAGVSAACGIAVAKDILRESIKGLLHTELAEAGLIHKLLKFLYPGFDADLKNYPNIEDFLNLVEMGELFNKEFIGSTLWSPAKLRGVKEKTLEIVTRYLWNGIQEKTSLVHLYNLSKRLLKRRNVIITFNWDLTVERAWNDKAGETLQIQYSFPGDRKGNNLYLLKPHGSIDWFRKKDLEGLPAAKKVESLGHSTLCYYPYFKLGKNPDLIKVLPVIVPPIWGKDFSSRFLRDTWASVYRAVSQAEDLHILGYSLPKEDQFARFVLRRALRNNLLRVRDGKKGRLNMRVVNPDDTVEGTFSRLVGVGDEEFGKAVRFRFIPATFENYLSWLEDEAQD